MDRVEFVFRDAVPGYRVEYQPGPFTRDASGEPVTVAGTAFLVVRLEPAYTYDLEAAEESTPARATSRPRARATCARW
ncbi:MAG: hypothetical protein KatS3mg009_1669 [Acidimicrobiia bacterium]|nr:MAG: hypothetical protein KatS3mg009_1669 [Acidimicrobiia bacterium]